MLTELGSDAARLLLDRSMVTPPVGAGLLSVKVPTEEAIPATVVGFRVRDASVGALMLKLADSVVPFRFALIVTDVSEGTGVVFTVNVPVVLPAATVTVAGTAAAALLLERLTTVPPEPAGPARVTVPVDVLPPGTEVGLIVRLEIGYVK